MNRFVLMMILGVSLSYASEFYSYEDAIALQKRTNKVILIDVVRTDCHYCVDMQKDVFDDESMSRWLKERFILVKINLDKDELPLDIDVSFTPSFYFVNNQQEVIKSIPGAWSIEDFKDLTRRIK